MFQAPFVNIIDPTASRLRAVDDGFIFLGKEDTDPTLPENQIPVYYTDENNVTQQLSQPIQLNATGVPVLSKSSGTIINPVFYADVVSIVIKKKGNNGDTVYSNKSYPALSDYFKHLFNAFGYEYSGQWAPNIQIPAKADRAGNYALWEPSSGKIIIPKIDAAFTTGATFQDDLSKGYWAFPIPVEIPTVTEMKLRTDILAGMEVKTNGYYKIGDGGHGEYLAESGNNGDGFVDHNVGSLTLKLQHNGSVNVEQGGVIAGQDYGINDTAIAALIDYVKTKFYAYIQFSEGSYGFSKIDCKNVQYIKIIGMGINKTVINCMVNTLEPFFDIGQRVNDSSNSNINFGDVGDFSINSYVPSEIGFSMSQFNRSTLRKIAVTGFSTNFDISYSWIVDAGKLLSVNHRAIGFKFHGGNINAFNIEQMSASSNASASTNYLIEDVHSLNVSTVNCEGSSAYGLTLSNVKGFKVGMWHHEGISIMRTIPSGLPLSPGGTFSIDAMHGFSIKGNIFAIDAASTIGSISISNACLEMTDYEIQNNLNIRLAAKTLKMDGVTVESIDDQSVITGIELFDYVRTNSTYTNINGEDPRKNRSKAVSVTANTMTDSKIAVNTRSSYMVYISYRSTATETVSAQYRLDVHDAYSSFTATKISGGDEILSPTVINGNIGVGSTYTLTLNVTMQKI